VLVFRVFAILALVLAAPSGGAQSSKPPDPLFRSADTLPVTITAPLSTLIRDKPGDDYLPGTLQYPAPDGALQTLDIGLQTRGHLRLDICDFPPLRINFKKSQTTGTLFAKQDKVKLVVNCESSIRFEQALVREYLAYRILNILTPYSFNVRLLRVTWVDSDAERDDKVRFAFLMEHKARLAKRIKRKPLKIEQTSIAALDPAQLNLTSVFQYLIGNTDFSPIAKSPYDECCHNYDLFSDDSSLLLGVPYDFDQAGFVNAPYAKPSEQFRIRSVRERVYRGRCENNAYLDATLQRFRDARTAIYALIENQEGLVPVIRKSLIDYVDEFYRVIDDPQILQREIVDSCI